MSQNLKIQVLLSAVDKLTAPFKNVSKQAQVLADAHKKARGELKNLQNQFKRNEEQINKYRNTFNPLKAQLSDTNNKLKEAQATANRLEKQFAKAKHPTAEFAKKLQEAKDKVKALKQVQSEQAQKLKVARDEFKRTGINVRELGHAQTELSRKMREANKAVKEQDERLKQLNQRAAAQQRYKQQVANLRQTGDNLRYMGQSAAIGGGAITGSGFKLLNPAIEFEQKFSKVEALTRLDKRNPEHAEALKKLEEQAIELGKTTAYTSAQVAEAQGYLAMAGFEWQDIINATPSVLQGAMASGAQLGRMSDILSDVGSAFKFKTEDFNKLTDLMVLTMTSTNTTEETLAETMKYIAPIATAMGQTPESTFALAGLLANVGIKGSQAGTTLKNIELNLINSKDLKDLGIKSTDAAGNMRQVTDILADLDKATKHMGTGQKGALFDKIIGKIGLAGAMELISQSSGGIQELTEKLKNAEGTAELVSRTMTDNLAGDLAALNSAREAVGVGIYKTIGGEIRKTAQSITGLLLKINEWIKSNPELTATIAKWTLAIGGSLTVIGLLSTLLGYLFYPIARLILGFGRLTGINTVLGVGLKKTTSRLGKFKTALVSSNRDMLSAKTTFLGLKDGAGKAKSGIVSFGKNAFARIKALPGTTMRFIRSLGQMKTWLNAIKAIGRVAFSPIRLALGAISMLFSPIGLGIAAIVAGASWITRHWAEVKAFFSGFWTGLTNGLKPLTPLFEKIGSAFGVVVGWLEKAFKWFTDLFTPIDSTKENLDAATKAGESFGAGLAKAIEILVSPINWLVEKFKWISDNMPSWEKITNGLKSVVSSEHVEHIANMANNMDDPNYTVPKKPKWSGGYAGNGGKYEPKGIYHGGEYIMTKEATARLGINNLNRLNYGKAAGLTALATTVAVAQPMQNVQFDTRAPVQAVQSRPQNAPVINQNVTITINASAGQSAEQIAQQIQKALADQQRKAQAKARSSLRDRY
ncbi:hypothetical protein A1D22_09470 [Pasteurellaceae bacterium LFhippo2]|nr:hypothetical protein [Pasteurellaceae bacterium LFhippo2]